MFSEVIVLDPILFVVTLCRVIKVIWTLMFIIYLKKSLRYLLGKA